ncbi:hypothetical protein VZC37_06345 [Gordonia sp. LSe1-13]|uniref:Serine hydrolase n=1 Tax=Gordonia sesuvii TaxID=3116777 RepID=A0ABU7MA11_9ACTN|nr:hypothetical protein [Gordonia sp. LSe1-13]
MRRSQISLLSAAAALVLAGCEVDLPGGEITPVTVTVTAGSSPALPATDASTPRDSPDQIKLRSGFNRLSASIGAPVGIAVAPVGGVADPRLQFGDQSSHVAWSTIKVPLALAAQRAIGPTAAETAAIVDSDNESAEHLWAALGTPAQAAAAVTGILREGRDEETIVPEQRRRPGFTVFGQTVWALPAAATFTANLRCLPGGRPVAALMSRVASNQKWGAEIMPSPTSTAVKGGWGPGIAGGYLVRQIALVDHSDGRATAVAMSAVADSLDSGVAHLNAIGNWLDAVLNQLPRGRC